MGHGGDDPVAGGFLVASMHWYAANVLEPTRALKRAGWPSLFPN